MMVTYHLKAHKRQRSTPKAQALKRLFVQFFSEPAVMSNQFDTETDPAHFPVQEDEGYEEDWLEQEVGYEAGDEHLEEKEYEPNLPV
jgi:hypothetical protein